MTYADPSRPKPPFWGPGGARLFRILVWLFLATAGIAGVLAAAAAPGAAPTKRAGIILHIGGAIGPASADYFSRGLAKAVEGGAALVVLRLDTPGGLDTSMRDVIRDILASPVPVATYISPSGARAASAGTFILYASHVAAVAPGTNLGAATPVQIGGLPLPGGEGAGDKKPGESKDEGDGARPKSGPARGAMEAKLVNDAAAYIRSLAEMRGRNADWAERAVREGASASARDALANNVVDILARDMDDLLAQMHGRSVTVGGAEITLDTRGLALATIEPDWRNRLLAAVTNPNVALILMMIGIYGLVFEFMNPGSLYPGIVGSICLLVGLYALAALPINYAGLALMALGLALMVAEAFTPSVGALGIGGAVAFALGAIILIDTDLPDFEVSKPTVVGIAAISLGLTVVIARLAITSHRRGVVSGREEMIGASGQVLEWSGPSGYVLSHGERWKAVSVAPLAPGRRVRVVALDGLTLKVEPETDTSKGASSHVD